jgi:peptide/nickel transport system substrate-binding protein
MKPLKKRSCLIILALVLVFSTITGCGGGGDTGSAETEINLLTMVEGNGPIFDWDPAIMFSTDNLVFSSVYETLLRYDPDQDVYLPVLATDYSVDEEGTIWTFTIREGVKFHDGTDLNAEAVKFSIDRTIEMGLGAAYIWSAVKSINVIDDYTVEFVCNYPSDIAMMASCGYAAYIYSPTAVGEDNDAATAWFSEGNECGTGPYVIQSHVQNAEVVLSAYEDYWGGWKDNQYDKILLKAVSENSSRRQMMESGEADLGVGFTLTDINALKSSDELTIYTANAYQTRAAYLNTQKAPLDNVTLRKALAYAWPYEEIVNSVWGTDFASVPTGLIPTSMWGSNESTPYKYDLDKAAELLVEAGYPNGGITLKYVYVSGNDNYRKMAEMYQSELAKIGVKLELQSITWDTMVSMHRDKLANQPDISAFMLWAEIPSPSAWYECAVLTNANTYFNQAHYSDADVDKMISDAIMYTGIDRAKATEIYQKIGQIVHDECIAIYQTEDKQVVVANNEVQGNLTGNRAYPSVIFFYELYK